MQTEEPVAASGMSFLEPGLSSSPSMKQRGKVDVEDALSPAGRCACRRARRFGSSPAWVETHDEFKYYMSDKPSLKVQIDEPEAACGMPLAEPGLPPSPSMEQHDEVGAPKMLLAPQVVVFVPPLEQPHG